ncbi:hypothetical protein LINGRAPRIM_LOCUS392 [Linum grandiflorum]
MMERWDGKENLEKLSFSTADLWVLIYNIPMSYKTRENAEVVATSLLCSCIDVEKKGVMKGVWFPFVMVHVEVDVTQSLLNMFALPTGKTKDLTKINYEKLQEYCTFYVKIGHEIDECETRSEHTSNGGSGKPSEFFAPSIKAGSQPRDLHDMLHHLAIGWMSEEGHLPTGWIIPETQQPTTDLWDAQ